MSRQETYLPHYTYSDYVQWEGRWELIEGHPIAMSPLPVPEHQRMASEIRFAFMVALKNKACQDCNAYDPIDYKINEDTILQPDVLIVCGKIDKQFLDFPPSLVVEILSPSTAIRDRNFKYNLYEKQGIRYYLIVDVKSKRIEVNKLNNGKYESIVAGKSFQFELTDDCQITADFSEVWE